MSAVAPLEQLLATVSTRAGETCTVLRHSLGAPLEPGAADVPWPCAPRDVVVAHFPGGPAPSAWGYGSGYGGNAILGKKALSLRLGSVLARDEGWYAEHMCVLGFSKDGARTRYVAAAFPSSCGKTAFSTMLPTVAGWAVSLVSDDLAWLRFDSRGVLRAVNPEVGCFGVAPGTASGSPAEVATRSGALFTNVALAGDDVWWEGLSPPPPSASSWLRRPWAPGSAAPAAHPNARFTARAAQVPTVDAAWQSAEGVAVEALIFGGRRDDTVPLVLEARSWVDGVLAAATLASKTTAAAEAAAGSLHEDPMAMRPFIGYDVGAYFEHWLDAGRLQAAAAAGAPHVPPLPRVFTVNFFRKGDDGRLLWPGFGDNARVVAYILHRLDGTAAAVATPAGLVPAPGALFTGGLALAPGALARALSVDLGEWAREGERARRFLDAVAAPRALVDAAAALAARVAAARAEGAPSGAAGE